MADFSYLIENNLRVWTDAFENIKARQVLPQC